MRSAVCPQLASRNRWPLRVCVKLIDRLQLVSIPKKHNNLSSSPIRPFFPTSYVSSRCTIKIISNHRTRLCWPNTLLHASTLSMNYIDVTQLSFLISKISQTKLETLTSLPHLYFFLTIVVSHLAMGVVLIRCYLMNRGVLFTPNVILLSGATLPMNHLSFSSSSTFIERTLHLHLKAKPSSYLWSFSLSFPPSLQVQKWTGPPVAFRYFFLKFPSSWLFTL